MDVTVAGLRNMGISGSFWLPLALFVAIHHAYLAQIFSKAFAVQGTVQAC